MGSKLNKRPKFQSERKCRSNKLLISQLCSAVKSKITAMVKAVVGEEAKLQPIEDRLSHSSLPAQVGLVIGKLSSNLDRGLVFDLLPTPQNDAGLPACSIMEPPKDDKKKASKSKSQPPDASSLLIDQDWVAEHARQVSRMLVGGIQVIGIYVWASETAFKNSTMVLCQTVQGVADAAAYLGASIDEGLLIHLCYSPRRWTCRNCTLSSNVTSSSLRPCDFKMGRVLSNLQTFKCLYNFDISFPIYSEGSSSFQTLNDALRHRISFHAKEIQNAKALIDGKLVVNGETESCSTDGLHEVELLLPFMKDEYMEACRQEDVAGVLVFSGSVYSYAYSNSKEPIFQAIADIKGDIIRSLYSRLDIICDAVDENKGLADDGSGETINETSSEESPSQLVLRSLRKTFSLSFPRRVFIQWLPGTFISDYLQPSETIEVAKDHCVELLSMEVPSAGTVILEPEEEAPRLTVESFWGVCVPCSVTSTSPERSVQNLRSETKQRSVDALNTSIIAAALFLLLSIVIGYIFVTR